MGQLGEQIGALLGEKGPGIMTDGPRVEDPEVAARMDLLLEIWISALMVGNLPLVAFTTLSVVRLSLKHGNADASACGYVAQAALCALQGDYDSARLFGGAGLTLARKLTNLSLVPKALNTYCNFTGHMVGHLRDNLAIYEESYEICLKTGDRWWGSWAVHWARVHRFLKGDVLDEVIQRAGAYHAYIVESGYVPLVWLSEVDQAAMRALMGTTASRGSLDHDSFSEQDLREAMTGAQFEYGIYVLELMKAWLAYLFEDHQAALEHLDRADKVKDVIPGGPEYSEYFFYGALILAAQPDPGPHLPRMDEYIERMQGWAENGAVENFGHCHALMAAERARLGGDDAEARLLYEQAIRLAQEHDYLHHAAMGCELAGRALLGSDGARAARGYLEDAVGFYGTWGARAKVDQLRERHRVLRQRERAADRSSTSSGTTRTLHGSKLDLDTVLDASNMIAGEIVLERLLSTVMFIILKNAGATRGALLLESPQGLRLQALAGPDGTEVLQDAPLGDELELPLSVLRYVERMGEMVLEDDAALEGPFAGDPDIEGRQVRSLLCVPLEHQGRRVGLLYTENTQAAAAFTDERVELLRVLSSQVATALENATLYATLEQKVEQRTAQLQQKNEQLQRTLKQLEEAQAQLIQSEKMAALGQLIAGVAHEINTPVGAIRASSENILDSLDQTLGEFPQLMAELPRDQAEQLIRLIRRSLEQREVLASRDLRRLRRRLEAALDELNVQGADDIAETLVDIGIYDEIEEEVPLLTGPSGEGVLRSAYDFAMLQRNSQTIQDAVGQVSKVVFALKSFTHSSPDDELISANIVDGIENVLTIYKNYLKRGVDVVRRYDEDLPLVSCNPDAMQQVWTNLIHNALQAMEYSGRLQIEVALKGPQMVVRITDDGPGIPVEVQPRLWDAFFTTKPAGEGTGLGLHISRDIVERHGGEISFTSRPGQTAFSVTLPTE